MDLHAQVDSIPTLLMEAQVKGIRATINTPTTFQNIDSSFINRFDSGKDLPQTLSQTASMVVTSDAGAGVGYTGMRIRGSDATRINITMNGIPMNDSESQGVFWVNTPDLISSVNSIQIQRGVGSSTNGAGAFGASVNLNTLGNSLSPLASYKIGYGSFNTLRQTLSASTGLLSNGLSLDIRLSSLNSDGYIDRASSDLKGYSFQLAWQKENQNLQFLAFGGREKTYQAWYGVDSLTFRNSPKTNYAGAIYDSNFAVSDYYDNETDNYGQDHFQLHYGWQINTNSSLTAGLHYTRGKGYYEQYRQNDQLSYYGLAPSIIGSDSIAETDLIRRLWLDNHFYGIIGQYKWKDAIQEVSIGGGFHRYEGDHFGDLQWLRFASNSEIRDKFYSNQSIKSDANLYVKWIRQLASKWTAYIDLQIRSVDYTGQGTDEGNLAVDFNEDLLFFNPKLGFTYSLSENSILYASYAIAHREGNRQDYLFGQPSPEELHDVELGFRGKQQKLAYSANAFWMQYQNQLILTGEIDNVGGFIRRNVGESFRLGLELEAQYSIDKDWDISGNLALSMNQNIDFKEVENDSAIVDLGNTTIAYSPSIVGGFILSYSPKSWLFSWSSRYVGDQYLSNEERASHILPSYFINDVRVAWQGSKSSFGKPVISLDLFNILDVQYASNGYVFAGDPYYYAQAGRHFMLTAQFNF
jgi:iron complex outermembrane receptor protein